MINKELCVCKTEPERDILPFGYRFICPNCKTHPYRIQDEQDEAIKDWNFFIDVITGKIDCPKWMTRRDWEEMQNEPNQNDT